MNILKIAITITLFLLVCGITFLMIHEIGRYAEDVGNQGKKDNDKDIARNKRDRREHDE